MASLSSKILSSVEVQNEKGNVHLPKATIAFQQEPDQIHTADMGADVPTQDPNIIAPTNKLNTVPVVPAKGSMTAEKPLASRKHAGIYRLTPYTTSTSTSEKQLPAKAVSGTRKGHQMTDTLKPMAEAISIPSAKTTASSGPADSIQFGNKPNAAKKASKSTPIPVKKPLIADDDMISRVADLFGVFPAEIYPGIPKMRVSKPYLWTVYCTALQKLKDSVAGPELRIWKNEKTFKVPAIPDLQAKAPGSTLPKIPKCLTVPQLKHFTVPEIPTPTTPKLPVIPNLKHFIRPMVPKNNPFTRRPAKENFKGPATSTNKNSTALAMSARKQEPVTDMPVEAIFKIPPPPKNKLAATPAISTWKTKPATRTPVGKPVKVPDVPTNKLSADAAMIAWKPKSVTGMHVRELSQVPAGPTNKFRTAPATLSSQNKPMRVKLLGERFKVPAPRRDNLSIAYVMPGKKLCYVMPALNVDALMVTRRNIQDHERLRCLPSENPYNLFNSKILERRENLKHATCTNSTALDMSARKEEPVANMPVELLFKLSPPPTNKFTAVPAISTLKPHPATKLPMGKFFKLPAVSTNKLAATTDLFARKSKSVKGLPVGKLFKVPAGPTNKLTTAPATLASQQKPLRAKLLWDSFKVPAPGSSKLSTAYVLPAKKLCNVMPALNVDALLGARSKNQDNEGLRSLPSANPDNMLEAKILSGHSSEFQNIPSVAPGNLSVFPKKLVVRRRKFKEFRGFKRRIRGLQYKLYYIQKILLNLPDKLSSK